jgi:membrane protein
MARADEVKGRDRVESSAGERSGRMRVVDIARETFKEFSSDDVPGMAASVAYHAIFALPPMLVVIVSLAAIVNQFTSVPVADNLTETIERSAPAVMKAFNRAYDVQEDRTFVRQKAVAIGLTMLMGLLVIAAFALFVFGERIGSEVADWLNLGSAFELVWGILRWPAAVLFIMFMLAVLYYLGPNIRQSFRWISPGSVLATVLWIAIALGFSFYMQFANPGSAYGAVGSVVVLLFYLYVSAMAFIVGAELNAVLQKRFDPATIEDLARNPEKVEGAENQIAAERRAVRLDQREGTDVSAAVPQARAVQRRKPGLGTRVLGYIGALILALVISRLRRPSRS